jgi:hypothetical protein
MLAGVCGVGRGGLAAAILVVVALSPAGSVVGGSVQAAVRLEGEPVTVATATTRDGRRIALIAQDSNQGLCLTLKRLEAPPERECDPPPTSSRFDASARSTFDRAPTPTSYFYGVVTARTAALELRFRGGRMHTYRATDGGYTGRFKGKVHFFLGVLPGNRRPVYSRALDTAGRVNAADEDQRAIRPYRGPVQIARGRNGVRAFRALAELKNMLAPAPNRPEGRSNFLCLLLKVSPSDVIGGSGASSSCAPLALHHHGIEGVFSLQHAHPDCPIPSLYMYGQVRPAAATLALSFADGTRQAVAAVDVRRSLGLRRKLFVLASSSRSDPVELDASSGSGRRVARVDLPKPGPRDLPGCSESFGFFASYR